MKKTTFNIRAFTLLELLVVVAILAVLAGMGSAALLSAAGKGDMVAEMAAAKTLVTAYHAAAEDNNGRYLPGYDASASNVLNTQKKPISMVQARARYPFRLAPYFNYAIKGTLLVGDNERQFMESMQIGSRSGTWYDYGVSQFPALGINRSFVGGYLNQDGTVDTNNTAADCIHTMAQADRSVIAFISAGADGVNGYAYVRAPASNWSGAEWTDKSDPGNYGYVDPRHNGKAVAAFLDGSVRVLGLDDLRDMRLWSRNAALLDNPGYQAQN